MRTTVPILSALMLILAAGAAAQEDTATFPLRDHRNESWMLPASPSVSAGPVGGLFNPAGFAFTDRAGLDFWWNDRSLRAGLDNYGFAGGRGLNFSVFSGTYRTRDHSVRLTDYQVGIAGGKRSHAWGLGYRWSGGRTHDMPRQQALTAGIMVRPNRWLTLGAASVLSLESAAAQHVFDLGLRPFGSPWLTLYGDVTANNDRILLKEGSMGFGLEVRPLRGVHLGVKARERVLADEFGYTFTAGVTLNDWDMTAANVTDRDLKHRYGSALVRTAAPFRGRTVPTGLILPVAGSYYRLNLENKVLTYQKFRWFDDRRIAWLDLLRLLEAVRQDPEISLVAVNLAGFRTRPSLGWEFRQQLERIRAAGKEVVVHTDRLDGTMLQLASVADRLSLDPWGLVQLPGAALSRSYLKGTLEKLGLGFQAHRYFEYKSAAETFSRSDMSEADRVQRQRIVDVIYETRRDQSAAGRDLSPVRYDQIVDEMVVLTPARALAAGLVDTLARWEDLTGWVARERHLRPAHGAPRPLRRRYWDERWGPAPRIPVVYAVGACAMDSGIKGRATSEHLRRLAKDPAVVAVVLRADSPGGDPLPSDLVAGAIRQLKAAGKPVIVSQGDVAASGGYWISMDGTEILTTPMTVTGSIGVISGWLWDDGFAGKLGITGDSVQRGAHADLFSRISLPFLGGLPRRAMTDQELAMTESLIREMYDGFVQAVAHGRGMSPQAVETVAQGRVWMGPDAVANGLCDRIGSLADAIETARRLAGLPPDIEIEMPEYPGRPLLEWPSFGPDLPVPFGLGDRLAGWLWRPAPRAAAAAPLAAVPEAAAGALGLDAAEVGFLRDVAAHPGRPVLRIEPDLLPPQWRQEY